MGIPQHHGAMHAQQAVQFRAQLRMIRRPVALQPALYVGRIGFAAGQVQRLAMKRIVGQQARRILARIQIRVFLRAVQVDRVARPARRQHGCVHLLQKAIQLAQMPVRIGLDQGLRRHARGDIIGYVGAHVGHRYQQRDAAFVEAEIHVCLLAPAQAYSGANKFLHVLLNSPCSTICLAASISGAKKRSASKNGTFWRSW